MENKGSRWVYHSNCPHLSWQHSCTGTPSDKIRSERAAILKLTSLCVFRCRFKDSWWLFKAAIRFFKVFWKVWNFSLNSPTVVGLDDFRWGDVWLGDDFAGLCCLIMAFFLSPSSDGADEDGLMLSLSLTGVVARDRPENICYARRLSDDPLATVCWRCADGNYTIK